LACGTLANVAKERHSLRAEWATIAGMLAHFLAGLLDNCKRVTSLENLKVKVNVNV